MGTLADKRLGDFLPTIDAYRPVALTVAAILGLVLIVPGAGGDSTGPGEEFSSSPAGVTETTVPSTPPTTAAPTTASSTPTTPTTLPAGDPVARSSSGAGGDPAPTPAPTTTTPPATTAAPSAPPAAGSSGDDDGDPQPLRIAASGWATVTAGVPLDGTPADDVPEGTLPVGTRVGQTDKMSFIRLTGDETTLVLAEDAAGRRGNEFEVPPVEVCQITESGWQAGEGQDMADAPDYDAGNCVAAQQSPDRTWSVSLLLFDDPADDRGFALVPTEDAPLDFQVTFAAQAIG